MGDARIEGLDGLSRKGPAGGVGYRDRDHDRDAPAGLVEQILDREKRRLGVQRVEDRLDKQRVDPGFEERPCLLRVGGDHLVPRDGAVVRAVDVGRSESVRFMGPMAPATKHRRPGDASSALRAAWRASRAPAAFSSATNDSVP